MKKMFLKISINSIKKKYPNFDQEKLDEISYGLEAIYLTITKMVIIFALAFALGIVKDTLFLLISYNIIRTTAFGMHAKKSIHCLIISIVFFIGGGIICKYISIPYYIKIAISIISLICLIKYAPADTYKRPLVNAKKRKIYKIITIINGIIFTVLIIVLKDNIIGTYLCLGILEATLMIHPLTYRMFQLPYNNYKSYDVSYS